MRTASHLLLGLFWSCSLLGATAALADAAFLPPTTLSGLPGLQSNSESNRAAVTPDGGYVVFDSTRLPPGERAPSNLLTDAEAPGVARVGGGIFRSNLTTGAIDLVVPRRLLDTTKTPQVFRPGTLRDLSPSVSADGRFVVFSTTMSLVPEDKNAVNDVYRRDMDAVATSPEAYTLVSAIDGGEAGLTYGPFGTEGSSTHQHAISEDGNRVAFIVLPSSNVGNVPATSTALSTPSGQVVVRDIARRRTIILSTTLVPPYGPAEYNPGVPVRPERAQISGDGSTVVWDAPTLLAARQVAMSQTYLGTAGLPLTIGSQTTVLWKRVDDGAAPTARLVAGASDPDDPACPPGGQPTSQVVPTPCDGPFPAFASENTGLLQLGAVSRDGTTIAVAGNSLRDSAAVGSGFSGTGTDVFLIDMRPGLSRKQATTRLTVGPGSENSVAQASYAGIALSPDANWVAFSATAWSSGAGGLRLPAPSGVFVPPVDPGIPSTYLIDRRNNTVEQVAFGYDGSGVDVGGVTDADLSDDAQVLVAASSATNVVYGDTNGVADVVAFRRLLPPEQRPAAIELPAPSARVPFASGAPRLRVLARSLSDGTAVLSVSSPVGGTLRTTTRRLAVVRRGGRKAKTQPRVALTRTAAARADGSVTIPLKLTRKYAALARRRGGLPASVAVTLTAPRAAPQVATVSVRFVKTATKPAPGSTAKRSR